MSSECFDWKSTRCSYHELEYLRGSHYGECPANPPLLFSIPHRSVRATFHRWVYESCHKITHARMLRRFLGHCFPSALSFTELCASGVPRVLPIPSSQRWRPHYFRFCQRSSRKSQIANNSFRVGKSSKLDWIAEKKHDTAT